MTVLLDNHTRALTSTRNPAPRKSRRNPDFPVVPAACRGSSSTNETENLLSSIKDANAALKRQPLTYEEKYSSLIKSLHSSSEDENLHNARNLREDLKDITISLQKWVDEVCVYYHSINFKLYKQNLDNQTPSFSMGDEVSIDQNLNASFTASMNSPGSLLNSATNKKTCLNTASDFDTLLNAYEPRTITDKDGNNMADFENNPPEALIHSLQTSLGVNVVVNSFSRKRMNFSR